MSMADDNTLRSYRSNDPYRRSANPADAQDPAPGDDPLAELARLIGQTDPYTDNVRRQPQGAAPRATQHAQDDASDWRRHIQRPNYEMRDEPAFDADPRYASADPRAGHAHHDPYRMASPEPEHYADPHADYRHDRPYAADADYADEQMYAAAQQRGYAGQHHSGVEAHGDDGYDDPPRRSRGSSFVTALVLIGCAMLGTAGAYGYRTYATTSGSKEAPVIIADNSPSKIVPAAEKKSARSQDRIGGQGGDEQLVSREEQPLALQAPNTSAVPRVVFPSPVLPAPATTGTTPPPGASNAQSVDQPKRISTIRIRPDGGDASAQPAGDAPSRAAPPPAARTAPPPAARVSRDQPLSLDPASPTQATEPARSQQRTSTVPTPRETAEPAPRVAAVPPAGGEGGYLVQVSSQRSESDAQASYRGLQAKYSQLKSRQPIIRRADLGTKGIYYRAMVGPFESADEAGQFCSGLKQAGGQCLILRN
jgi:hypothetical protein